MIIDLPRKNNYQWLQIYNEKIKANLKIKYDKKPNGTPRKVDCKLASTYGWKSRFSLGKGFKLTHEDFK